VKSSLTPVEPETKRMADWSSLRCPRMGTSCGAILVPALPGSRGSLEAVEFQRDPAWRCRGGRARRI